MQNCIHSGYSGIYHPLASSLNGPLPVSIFCISNRFNTFIVMLPTTPLFAKDVISVARNIPTNSVYLIATDMDISTISDFYYSWDYIKHKLKKECKIFTKYLPENTLPKEYQADIVRNNNDVSCISIPRSDLDHGTITIAFMKNYVLGGNPFSCDVVIDDTFKKRYFIKELNEQKANFLYDIHDSYDELHMPYIASEYGSMTYHQLITRYPALITKTYTNQFMSYEEYTYARDHGAKIGERFDLIRW